jgi:hypothetical protein
VIFRSENRSALLSICAIASVVIVTQLSAISSAADVDGVMMSDGKMMLMKAGHPALAMDHPITLSDGAIVEVDGTVKSKDGTEFRLRNGDMIMMDGHLMRGGGKPEPMGSGEPG